MPLLVLSFRHVIGLFSSTLFSRIWFIFGPILCYIFGLLCTWLFSFWAFVRHQNFSHLLRSKLKSCRKNRWYVCYYARPFWPFLKAFFTFENAYFVHFCLFFAILLLFRFVPEVFWSTLLATIWSIFGPLSLLLKFIFQVKKFHFQELMICLWLCKAWTIWHPMRKRLEIFLKIWGKRWNMRELPLLSHPLQTL